MRKQVVLYNPRAPYYTLPLQFLALASVLPADEYEVTIIDARIEASAARAHAKVLATLDTAFCIGVSVITGMPIQDAASLTAKVKQHSPGLPVVWGGWHPSIYPEQCLREGGADFCVLGQGEASFAELLGGLADNVPFGEIDGIAYLSGSNFVQTKDRRFIDINNFPAYDYDLLPLERYFELKGKRQIDFYSSQGCPYRCGFCADPYVYKRRWSGLKGGRLLEDVFEVVKRHRIDDIIFQDENFFANRDRVLQFCHGAAREKLKISWVATSRADQLSPVAESDLREMRRAGLRKAVVGVESGSQELLDLMKKDTLAGDALMAAEKLSRCDIGAMFGFIVGLPGESFTDTMKTLDLIRELKRISHRFDFNIFYFTPYPGTDLFKMMVDQGYSVPSSLREWSELDFLSYAGYWLPEEEKEHVENFKFYQRLASDQTLWLRPLRGLARMRTTNHDYRLPIERRLAGLLKRSASPYY